MSENKSIIDQLKSNTSAFGLMSEELKDAALKIASNGFKKEFFQLYRGGETGWRGADNDNFLPDYCYRLNDGFLCEHAEKEAIIPTFHGSSAHACKWCGLELPSPKPKMGWVIYPIFLLCDSDLPYYCVRYSDGDSDFETVGDARDNQGFGGIQYEAPGRNGVTTPFLMFPAESCDDKLGPFIPVKIRFFEEL